MQGLLLALEKKLEGEVAVAKANIEVYISQSVGIGEHPDLVGAIEEQLVKLAEAEEKLETLQKHFLLPDEFSVKIYDNPIEV
jgi:hypothetical protein